LTLFAGSSYVEGEYTMLRIYQKKGWFPLAFLFIFLTLACGRETRAEERPKFTIQTLPGDKGSTVSKMWGVATTIKIVETVYLPNTCDRIDGEVDIRKRGAEILVKLKPQDKNHLREEGCSQIETPVLVMVTIPDMPFIPGCMHNIRLETPQRTIMDTVTINW
jgi:hypothetical protein